MPYIITAIHSEMAILEPNMKSAEQEIAELLPQFPEVEVLVGIPGVDLAAITAFLAILPKEIWALPKQAASWCALAAPPGRRSPKASFGPTATARGIPLLQDNLIQAARGATECNPTIAEFHKRLLQRGKSEEEALVACAHKLLRIMCGTLKDYYRSLAPEPGEPEA